VSLHNGIDTVAVISLGDFSKTYGVGEESNTANLFVTDGLLEDAPAPARGGFWHQLVGWFWDFF